MPPKSLTRRGGARSVAVSATHPANVATAAAKKNAGGVMQLPSPLGNPPRTLQRPLPSRGFKQRRMLKCMPPLRLLHLTQPRLRLGWLFSLTVVWLAKYILLLAPHLAMTLRGESRHRLRRGRVGASAFFPPLVECLVVWWLSCLTFCW
jgi:hypothetical protein